MKAHAKVRFVRQQGLSWREGIPSLTPSLYTQKAQALQAKLLPVKVHLHSFCLVRLGGKQTSDNYCHCNLKSLETNTFEP